MSLPSQVRAARSMPAIACEFLCKGNWESASSPSAQATCSSRAPKLCPAPGQDCWCLSPGRETVRKATAWTKHENVQVMVLPPETNDESLVMTSSFTNLMLAARFLGMLNEPERYRNLCVSLGNIVQKLLVENFDKLARVR